MSTSILALTLLSLFSGVLGHHVGRRQGDSSIHDPEALLSRAIAALGGSENISNVQSVAYVGGTVLRGRTLMLAASLNGLDTAGTSNGKQNVTFSYGQPHVSQRIDRLAQLGPTFTFGRADLSPMDYSMIVQGGNEGFASVVRGSYNIYNPSGEPTGYTDGILAEYLILDAYKWDPLLVSKMLSNGNFTSRREEVVSGIELPGVHDESLGITVLFDQETSLPYVIRTYEDHPFFGPSTHDLRVSGYAGVDGVQLPMRFKTIYNNKHVIGDYRADEVLINPKVPEDFFQVPGNGTVPEASMPVRDPEYSFAEIGELASIYLWGGAYSGSLDVLEATQPLADVPGLWELNIAGGMGMRQAVVELEDGSVIVLDAPPHQSKIIIEWAEQTLGKPVSHVWPTHHHHDHAFGVADFVANGAKLIAPEQATSYYSGLNLNDDQLVTYKFGEPLVFGDGRTQLALVDMQGTIHAHDHGYAYIRPTCPTANSSTAVFDADHGNLNFIDTFDHNAVEELLGALASDGVAASARFLASHGPAGTLQDLTSITAYRYPSHLPTDFKFGSTQCI